MMVNQCHRLFKSIFTLLKRSQDQPLKLRQIVAQFIKLRHNYAMHP
jgi:hypothetical protein